MKGKLEMVVQKKNKQIYLIIFLSLFLAMLPVILSNNYLRQDDFKTGIWWGMKIRDEGFFFYNTVMQLVRPICMFIMFLVDLISINMHNAVYIRLASILNVCLLGILLYRWQSNFNQNRLVNATFAITAFTLPGIQLFAATANYFLIIFGILLTFGGPIYWYKSYQANTRVEKIKYLLLGSILFFSSFLDYPFSSMYAWVLLGICYLNSLTVNQVDGVRLRKFFYYASFLTMAITFSYFIFIHLVHFIGHVDVSYGRVGSSIKDILPRSVWIFEILHWHALLWFYWPGYWLLNYYPLVMLAILLGCALIKIGFKSPENKIKRLCINLFFVPSLLFILFFLCYFPALAAPENSIGYTFRYTLATMPLLLYVFFWSIQTLTSYSFQSLFLSLLQKSANLLLIFMAAFGVYYANLKLGDGIVGPQDNDFRFIKSQLKQKVVPLLKQHKLVLLHVIDCDHGKNYKYEQDVPDALEYGMRLCVFPNHLVSAIDHSLKVLGFASNNERINGVFGDDKIFVLKDVPWGNIIISSGKDYDGSHLDYPKEKMTEVVIDMRESPKYKHLDFHKRILASILPK